MPTLEARLDALEAALKPITTQLPLLNFRAYDGRTGEFVEGSDWYCVPGIPHGPNGYRMDRNEGEPDADYLERAKLAAKQQMMRL